MLSIETREPRIDNVRIQSGEVEVAAYGASEAGLYPLVIFPGLAATHSAYDDIAKRIDGEVVVLNPPHPHMLPRPTMGGYAAVQNEVISQLGYDQVDILGESWGGILAQKYAQNFASRVGNVVLAVTAPGTLLFNMPPNLLVMSNLMSNDRSGQFLEQHGAKLFAGDMADPALRAKYMSVFERKVDPESKQCQMMAASVWGWYDFKRLSGWQQPTLLMASDDDPLAPVWNNRRAHAKMNNIVAYHEETNGGHLFLHTRAERAAKIINGFRAQQKSLLQLAA